MTELPYQQIPPAPEQFTAAATLVRLADGIAFRFRWATEGLREEDLDFRPCDGSMNMRELFDHLIFLMDLIHVALDPDRTGFRDKCADLESFRLNILRRITAIRDQLSSMSDVELARCQVPIKSGKVYPVWHLINGPMADILTHIGQINSWRRIAGNPAPKANVFLGLAPREQDVKQ